nr:hypothetical protein [Phytoactinopolyspora endophytica]
MAGAASPGFAINSATDNPEEAERFLEFLASEEGIRLYQEATGAVTTTSNYEPELDPALDIVFEHVVEGEIYLPTISWPRHEDALRVEQVAKVQEMVMGQISPADVADALDRKLAELDG